MPETPHPQGDRETGGETPDTVGKPGETPDTAGLSEDPRQAAGPPGEPRDIAAAPEGTAASAGLLEQTPDTAGLSEDARQAAGPPGEPRDAVGEPEGTPGATGFPGQAPDTAEVPEETPAAATRPAPRGPGGRPLRVAHLTTVDVSLALLLRTELEEDVAAGFETYGLSAPGPYVAGIEALGVTHVPLRALTRAWNPRADAAAAAELVRVLRRLRPDVLHTHNPKTGVLGRLIGRAARVPVVVNTCHGLWIRPDDPWPKRAFVLGAEGAAARVSHAELYQNATDSATMRRAVPAWRSRVVGNGTDLGRFRPDPRARAAVRRELGVAEGELLVGGVGRRVAEKGILEYLEAARLLAGKARFVWIGPDDPDKTDALSADRHGAPVGFTGPRDDMPAVYNALDVFALPSHREGFSRSAMEAAATGLPMVLTDIRGCREIGTPGEHALFVPAGDPRALADALARLLTEPELRTRLAGAARRRALAEFDQRRVARTSIDTYRAVARRRGLGWT